MPAVNIADLALLELLIYRVSNEAPDCELLREHLDSARTYFDARPAEYEFALNLAREALTGVSNPDLREQIERFINQQLPPSKA